MAVIPQTPLPLAAPPRTLRREWLLLGISVLLLAAIVMPPLINLGRYQHRIAASMSRSLGRRVSMSAISLRLLPVPALVLSDVVVNEDPLFGAEPALRAPSVTAQLRLASLWRGAFEVSRVELSEASLNLVRNPEGRWNVGSVLLQASHVPNAPTGQRHPGPAPRFPYIEITDSRVNVKQGIEKLPYSLLNANLSMWLAEPDLWRLKIEAQPVRTDVEMGLADSGLLRVEGTLHRATALGHMPVALHADWANAPLGQASRLLLGRDGGWRGDLHATADASGELDSLAVTTHLAVANLHRQEFTPAEPFTVDATCSAAYSRAAQKVDGLSCRWPVGNGLLLLTGALQMGPGGRVLPALALHAQRLPSAFLLAAAGLASSDVAPVFNVAGEWNGTLSYGDEDKSPNASENSTRNGSGPGQAPQLAGAFDAEQLTLAAGESPLALRRMRLAAAPGATALMLTGDPVELGRGSEAEVDGQVTRLGFAVHASGSGTVARLADLARSLGSTHSPLQHLGPQGTAEFDLTRRGEWQQEEAAAALGPPTAARLDQNRRRTQRAAGRRGTLGFVTGSVAVSQSVPGMGTTPDNGRAEDLITAPGTSGWLRLHHVEYAAPFLREPVLVDFAEATLRAGEIDWNAPAASYHGIPFEVSATYPLECTAPPCATRFTAQLASLDAGELAAALGVAGQPLVDQLLSRLGQHPDPWPPMTGSLRAETLTVGRLALRQAEVTLSIAQGQVRLASLRAKALGGTLAGTGFLQMEGGVPAYQLSSTLTGASALAAGSLFHERWGSGTLTVTSQLHLSGRTATELAASAVGSWRGEWLHGGLGGETALAHFTSWTGEGRIGGSSVTLLAGRLTTHAAAAPAGEGSSVTGRIGFDRGLALELGAARAAVNGTLEHPVQAEQNAAPAAR
ncbi:MAG TPA: AsmA family protein [Acidobacteriaceae bacterium]